MRKNKGFSLIEMLIIVAMIAALVAIGYPYFRGVMEKNKENADIAAMHSAEALMETAYNTRLIIDGKSATEAKATGPLYYDPSGKLVWKRPAPYGQGTAGNQGVTWSCCGDYAYNPANDYRQGVIVCYYTPEGNNNPYPGIHVHWDCDGSGTITPDPVVKPTKPVFPERPTTEPTEGVKDDNTEATTEATTEPTTPKEDWTPEEIESTGHPWPTMKENPYSDYWWETDDMIPEAGHRFVYNGKVYVALKDAPKNQDYRKIDPASSDYSWLFAELTGRTFTSDKNVDSDGKVYVTVGTGQNYTVNFCPGDVFIQRNGDHLDYYVWNTWGGKPGEPVSAGVSPTAPNAANWTKLMTYRDCPHCGDVTIPKTNQ